ncbi:MAG: ROK family protein [Bacteroidales bacterium]|jgi:glucokinase|nr:ROK family protein [Bacteroidales bacterium]MDN5348950.1 glucokinase [Bacteroidales bacterium]
MKKVAIGIDVGGTNTAIGVVDNEGKVLVKDSIPTPGHSNITLFIDDITNSVRELVNSVGSLNPKVEILGLGIGAPNANYYTGTIEHAPNLSFKGVIPMVKLLEENFPEMKAIAITNDANAAAIGEMIYGGAQGMKNFVVYTLGTGVGSGIIVNGDLVYGHDGFAGECGHTTIINNGRLCGCGGKGHLEAYCSAPGMKRTAFELLAKYNATKSILATKCFNEMDSKFIFEAAEAGDAIAKEVFELTGKWLGIGLANTVAHTSPEAIFLFGGPMAAGNYILRPTIESMEQHLIPIFKNKVKILPSQLKPGDAAIVGASALVYKELEKQLG